MRLRRHGLALALLSVVATGRAQHDHAEHEASVEKPRIFWTTPTAVKFQLRQLSNAQLLLVDRNTSDPKYIPVYETMLVRPALPSEVRAEAVAALVELTNSDVATVLLRAIAAAAKQKDVEGVLHELGHMLLSRGPEPLAAHRATIATLANESSHPLVRRIAYAGRLTLREDVDGLWAEAERAGHRADVLAGLSMVPASAPRSAMYSHVKSLLDAAADPELQAAAIEALPHIPDHEVESFRALAGFVRRSVQRGPALRAISRIDPTQWPNDELAPLADEIVRFVASASPEQRTEPERVDAVQLGHAIADRLPDADAAILRKNLRSLGVTVVLLRTIRHEMRYDKKFFAVPAGRAVQILLENDDVMPHNVVIVKPGGLEPVGTAADLMQPKPGEEKPYIPDSDLVLHASRLVQPDQRDRLSFVAPESPGEYPFVCTFPGHWRRMYGVMVVVEDFDAWLADPQEPADPLGNTRTFVKNWTLDDFPADLASVARARSFARGKQVFAEAGCTSCHRMRGEGGQVGPELTEVFTKLEKDRRALLRELLEPSAKVDPQYQMSIIQTEDGAQLMGLITERNEQFVSVVMNPQNPVPFQLETETIEREAKSENSIMPVGTLDIFTREEILDLLAYLESGGDPSHSAFAP